MQQAMFHPGQAVSSHDSWSRRFTSTAQGLLVIVFGLLPVLFIPSTVAPFGYSKALIAVFGVTFAVLFYSLAVLREGSITVRAPLTLVAFWFLAFVTTLSALFSGDFSDSFIGVDFAPQSAAFMILLAAVASVATLCRTSKSSLIRIYSLIVVSAVLLGVFHVLRLIFGADFLSFGLLTSSASSPIGGWNDLALFFGLALILALVALEQLPLKTLGRVVLGVTAVLALIMLAVVNFFAVWLVLGIVSLVMLMYVLTKHRFTQSPLDGMGESADTSNWLSVSLSMVVFITSVLFVIGGSALGGVVANTVGFEYVQVSPSFDATVDIARSVYSENAFVGVGPNKFSDAWRLYKDEGINQTTYWNTTFSEGSGFITTSFVNTGIFGIIAWLLFLGTLMYSGARLVFSNTQADRFWYFMATSSFVAAVYLWGMSFIYSPTTVMLILAALCTGILVTAQGVIMPGRSFALSVIHDKRAGFALVAAVIVVIVGSVSVLYFAGRHYAAVYSFSGALNSITQGATIESVEQNIAEAYQISNNDLFARQIAGYQLARLNALLTLVEPTETQLQQFQQAAVNGINAAQLAITNDTTEPSSWQILGQIYSILAVAEVEGAYDRAVEAFANARQYDPKSPLYALLEAQLELRAGNVEAAKIKASEAVNVKRNYTEALVFLAEIDITEGNIEQAVTRTEAIVSIEPNNPARLYQLGLLYSAAENQDGAIRAFATAVNLDNNYANARYLLGVLLAERGDVDAAIAQLEFVQGLNPDNQELQIILESLRTNGTLPTATPAQAVIDPDPVVEEGGQISTTEEPDTNLVTPVNTVPASEDEVIPDESETIQAGS